MLHLSKYFSLILIVLFVFSCSGSKQMGEASGSGGVGLADVHLQAKIKDLQKKIKKNPNNMEYRQQLASIYFENGHNLEAMKVLEEAIKIDPNNPEVKYQYGEIAFKSGDKLRAFKTFKSVLQGVDGENYLSRISPYFVDTFQDSPLVATDAQEAFGAFSPDGKKIIYQSDVNGNWDLFILNLETGETQQVTNTPAHEENPSFSPDGRHIVYTSTADDHRDVDFNQKLRDIFVMDLTTHKEENLTRNGSDDWLPRYSFSGKFITFVSQRNDLREDVPFYELHSDIFIMENTGRFQLALTNDAANDGSPQLFPGSTDEDGTVIFDSDRNNGKYAIYKMDLRSKEIKQLTFNPNANDVAPCISASGDKVVFFSDRDGNYEVYMMNDDGSAQQRLTSNPADDLNPVFSPDGTKVLFHTNRKGNYDIYVMDLNRPASQISMSDLIDRIDVAIQALEEMQ
jgi:Tol biopolymer transport system component